MDTIIRGRRTAEPRSGGKILRGRRGAATTSPYSRPNTPPPASESPNWFSRLFSPAAGAARIIVNGVGDLLSPLLFGNESSPSSSWTSSNSSSGNDDDGNDISSEGAEELNLNGGPSNMNKHFEEPQPVLWNSESKRAIKQLILKETFTRDECDRLTKIIQSQVVECPGIKEGEDTRQKKLLDRTVGSSIAFPEALEPEWQTRNSLTPNASELERNMPSVCNTAVLEARKWLEEKKLKSSSKSGLDMGMHTSDSIMQIHAAEGEVGSPVDVAKSYMRARPPWASPSLRHGGSQTPSPIGTCLFRDETPFGLGDQSLSSSKILKRNSISTGPWDILEEIRRVRLKATKDILEPFAKEIDLPAIVLENIGGQISSASDIISPEVGGTLNHSDSLPETQSVDETAHLPAGPAEISTDDGSPENLKHGKSLSTILVADAVNDSPINEAFFSIPAVIVSERNQDLEDSRPIEGVGTSFVDDSLAPDSIPVQHNGPQDVSVHTSNSGQEVKSAEDTKPALQGDAIDVNGLDDANRAGSPSRSPVGDVQTKVSSQSLQCSGMRGTQSLDDSRPLGGNHETRQDANVLGDHVITNGFASLASSLSPEVDASPSLRPADVEEPNSISSGHVKLDSQTPMQDNCELLSEASMEIPIIEETESIVSGSQNSSGKQYEDSSQSPLLLNSKHSLEDKSSTRVGKQGGKKMGKYSRRGKGRGKA